MHGIVEIVRSLDLGHGIKIEELFLRLEENGISRQQAEKSIEKLKQNGMLFEPSFGVYKAT